MSFRRNLLILLAHGLRSDAVGDSNTWPLLTPHMEKFAKRGLRLVAHAACPADYGAQASVLSGLHPRQHHWVEPTTTPVAVEGWPAWLAEAGYHLVGVGCVLALAPWLRQAVLVHGPDQIEPAGCAYLSAMKDRSLLAAIQQQRRQRLRYGIFDPDRLLLQPDDDIDGFIINQARRVIDDLPSDRPWALVVVLSGPDNGLPPPAMYSEVVATHLLEAGFCPPDLRRLNALAELDYPRVLLQRFEPHKLARIRADYLGRVCLMDFGVGRLVGQVSRRADAARTWTVLAGDRGMLLGEHGIVGHRSFLCPALETPILIAGPNPARPRVHDTAMISTTDLAPTIAALASCDVPPACCGRSLLPLLTGHVYDNPLAHNGGLISEGGRRLMLQTERHKLVLDVDTHGPLLLFDLINDPEERDNLADTAVGRNILDALRWRLGDTLLPIRSA